MHDLFISSLNIEDFCFWQAQAHFVKFLDKTFPIQSPNSRMRKYWDIIVIIFVLYNAVLVPYDAGEHTSSSSKP